MNKRDIEINTDAGAVAGLAIIAEFLAPIAIGIIGITALGVAEVARVKKGGLEKALAIKKSRFGKNNRFR